MKKLILLVGLFLTLCFSVDAATIDFMHLATFGHYWQDYEPNSTNDRLNHFMIVPSADYYELNDGSSWDSGAGWHPNTYATLSEMDTLDSMISYTFTSPSHYVSGLPDGNLFFNIDYNAGNHSSQGTLGVVGDLTIEAILGSQTAIMNGYAQILSNDETSYGTPRFNYYSAKVDDIVPFSINYELRGTTWSENIFDSEFEYNLTGVVDFTHPVPEPTTMIMFGSGLIGIWKRRKNTYI